MARRRRQLGGEGARAEAGQCSLGIPSLPSEWLIARRAASTRSRGTSPGTAAGNRPRAGRASARRRATRGGRCHHRTEVSSRRLRPPAAARPARGTTRPAGSGARAARRCRRGPGPATRTAGPAAEGTRTVAHSRRCRTMRWPSAAEPSQPRMGSVRQLGQIPAGGDVAQGLPRAQRHLVVLGADHLGQLLERRPRSSQRSSTRRAPSMVQSASSTVSAITGTAELAPQRLQPPLRGRRAGRPGHAQDGAPARAAAARTCSAWMRPICVWSGVTPKMGTPGNSDPQRRQVAGLAVEQHPADAARRRLPGDLGQRVVADRAHQHGRQRIRLGPGEGLGDLGRLLARDRCRPRTPGPRIPPRPPTLTASSANRA